VSCDPASNVAVLYHANCSDGFAAAFILCKVHPGCLVIPVNYGQPIPYLPERITHVIIADFSYPKEQLLAMNERITFEIYDHHLKTGVEELFASHPHRFRGRADSQYCGAVLVWQSLYPNENPPKWLQYIQDRDLWQWKLPNSREFSAGLRSLPLDADVWNKLFGYYRADGEYAIQRLIGDGEVVLRVHRVLVRSIVDRAQVIQFYGYRCVLIDAPVLVSEACETALATFPDAEVAMAHFRDGANVIWNFRSLEGGPDVSLLAKHFGGGGHRHAAGCVVQGSEACHLIPLPSTSVIQGSET